MKTFNIIAAIDEKFGIGKDGKMPWYIPSDLKYFKYITKKTTNISKMNAIIMGRNTWNSISSKYKPLVDRINIIVTNSDEDFFGAHTEINLISALELAYSFDNLEDIFVIGGGKIYEEALNLSNLSSEWILNKLYITRVNGDFGCDVFFPRELIQPNKCKFIESLPEKIENNFLFKITTYEHMSNKKIIYQEHEYLSLLKRIMLHGKSKSNRTGIKVLSKFGERLNFNLRGGVFPLLTTKKMFTRGIIEELLWFLRGQTDASILQEKNVHIWDGNSTREYLDSVGLKHLNEGDIGPGYGFQWKHFGADYYNCKTEYAGEGIDQVEYIRDLLQNDKDSRRIILSAWNPTNLREMALPPCHVLYQFYTQGRELSLNVYLRSNDLFLGCPFNIASSALLLYMMASICDYDVAELNLFIGDAHIYSNHIRQVREQLSRTPMSFPTLEILRIPKSISEFEVSDFKFKDYNSYSAIPAKMAV